MQSFGFSSFLLGIKSVLSRIYLANPGLLVGKRSVVVAFDAFVSLD